MSDKNKYNAVAVGSFRLAVRVQQAFVAQKLFQPVVVDIDGKKFMWDGRSNFHVQSKEDKSWNPLLVNGYAADHRLPDLAVLLQFVERVYIAAVDKRNKVADMLECGITEAETFLLVHAEPYPREDDEENEEDQDREIA